MQARDGHAFNVHVATDAGQRPEHAATRSSFTLTWMGGQSPLLTPLVLLLLPLLMAWVAGLLVEDDSARNATTTTTTTSKC